jgi:DNA mismatch endonuclease (patch repair protein)
MPDDRSPAQRSRTMAAIRSKDTRLELLVRSALHAQGVRFRLDQRIKCNGRTIRPDLVFSKSGVAVFLDGCFWHGCVDHCRLPSSNRDYWEQKIERTRVRDRRTDTDLSREGWTVVRHWEHESPENIATSISSILGRQVTPRRGAHSAMPEHGASMYGNQGCRCDICRAGKAAQQRALMARYKEAGGRGIHGTPYRYDTGCRCDRCRTAHNEKSRAWKQKKRALKSNEAS